MSKSCTKYFPAAFEEGNQFDQDMVDGVSLGPLLNVLVDRDYQYESFFKLNQIE